MQQRPCHESKKIKRKEAGVGDRGKKKQRRRKEEIGGKDESIKMLSSAQSRALLAVGGGSCLFLFFFLFILVCMVFIRSTRAEAGERSKERWKEYRHGPRAKIITDRN